MAEYRDSVEIAAPPVFDYLVTEAGMPAWTGHNEGAPP